MARPAWVLSLVEKGWQQARERERQAEGEWRVLHLAKGRMAASVRALLRRHCGVRLLGVPKPAFWPAVFALLIAGAALRRPRRLLVDNERALRRLARWALRLGWTCELIRPPAGGAAYAAPAAARAPAAGSAQERGRRLALVFDRDRPDTTGTYFERACERLAVACDAWEVRDAARIPAGYGAYLRIDHGDYGADLPGRLRPRVFYAIDTHLLKSWAKIQALARRYDLVCCAQRQAALHLGARALWAPLAADPTLRDPAPCGGPWDVAFVGSDGGIPRKFLLQLVRECCPRSYIGPAPHGQLLEIYRQARIGFNYSIRGEINMRVFEVLAAGALLLTNRLPREDMALLGLAEGVHYAVYDAVEELLPAIGAWLADEPRRARVARAGAAAGRPHTYEARLRQILAAMAERLGVAITARVPAQQAAAQESVPCASL
jgi:hypothetical protein